MTGRAPTDKPRDTSISRKSQTILVIGEDPQSRALFREALAISDYDVLEAVNYQHADLLSGQLQGSLDLILGCSHSDREASNIKRWHVHHGSVPLLVIPADHATRESSIEEVALRVRLALEAARPSRTILIVDEDGSERRVIAELLETAGYQVTQASNGKEALALLAADPPDVVLTDIVMSEKDGLELIRDTRRRYLKTTIVAMSGTTQAGGYLSMARLLGAKRILKKPLNVHQLLRALFEATEPVPKRSQAEFR